MSGAIGHDRGVRRVTGALALALLLLTGCDALDAALGDTDGDGSSDPRAADAGGVRGDPEDWLATVCGPDADVEHEEPYNSDYTATRTAQYVCMVDGADVGDSEVDEYEVVAAVYTTDPEDDLVGESDSFKSGDGNELAYAYGETEDGWAVIWLYPDFGVAKESVLEPLEDDGFAVGKVDYGG